jgi:hypothetical protein
MTEYNYRQLVVAAIVRHIEDQIQDVFRKYGRAFKMTGVDSDNTRREILSMFKDAIRILEESS